MADILALANRKIMTLVIPRKERVKDKKQNENKKIDWQTTAYSNGSSLVIKKNDEEPIDSCEPNDYCDLCFITLKHRHRCLLLISFLLSYTDIFNLFSVSLTMISRNHLHFIKCIFFCLEKLQRSTPLVLIDFSNRFYLIYFIHIWYS